MLLEAPCVGTSDQINTLHGWGILIDIDRSIQLLKAFTQKRGTRSYCMNETISPSGWNLEGREGALLLEVYLCKGKEFLDQTL